MDWNLFTGERAGTDALLLADFAKDAHGTYGADLGCGSGILSIAALLLGALQNAKQKGLSLTDDCSAVEALGMTVLLTDGSEENIKITTPLDLDIAELILKRRQTP